MYKLLITVTVLFSFIGWCFYYAFKGKKVKNEKEKIKYFKNKFKNLVDKKENGMIIDEIEISPPHNLFHKDVWIVRKHLKSTNFFSNSTDRKEIFRVKDSELNEDDDYINFLK